MRRWLQKKLWEPLRLLLDGLFVKMVQAAAPMATGRRRVLLVRLDRIGDFILWLDAAQALRRLYPPEQYEITLLGNQEWAVLAEASPHFDELWTLERRRFYRDPRYRYQWLKRVRRAGFSIVIQPAYSRELLFGDAVVRASGAAERIGSTGDLTNITAAHKRISDGWYTRLISAAEQPLMELERNAEFVRGLGVRSFQAGLPRLPVARTWRPAGEAKSYYVLFPGASGAQRRWPLANFSALAARLAQAYEWELVLCGGPGEEELGAELLRRLRRPAHNLIGRTSLSELAEIIAGAQLLISNETGAAHLAAAVATPVVCVTGGGHYGRFAPYPAGLAEKGSLPVIAAQPLDCFGCDWHCIYQTADGEPFPCLANVTVEQVWAAVEQALAQRRSPMLAG